MAQRREGLGVTIIVGLVLIALGLASFVAGAVAYMQQADTPSEVQRGTDASQIDIQTPDKLWDLYETFDDDAKDRAAGDPAADDGELHDARNDDVSYRIVDESWGHDEVEQLKAYGCDVWCVFEVAYPQLEGDFEHLDKINRLLKKAAFETVRTYYEDPSAETVERVKLMGKGDSEEPDAKASLILTSDVDCAVTYNNEDFISVCYSDWHYLGSRYMGYIALRTVNVNLKTGEVYQLDDVLRVSRDMAVSFVDNLVRETGVDANGDGSIDSDECLSVKIAGRSGLIRALRGRGDLADRVQTCFFVDGNGKVNLGATYWLSSEAGYVIGWWDVTLTDEQVAADKRDSRFWELL